MGIHISASFMQPIGATAASAVTARLQALLPALHAAGGLQSGDVIACAGMHFRVDIRIWTVDQDALALEIVLLHESWHEGNRA